MTDVPEPRQDEPVAPQDDRLTEELETLYHRVASLDSREAGSAIDEKPDSYYKVLQIRPGASLSDIHFAYKRMTDAWEPGRYPKVPSWRETSAEKLKEIKYAYEKLLLLHTARKTADKGDAPKQPLTTAFLAFPERTDAEATAPVREEIDEPPGSRFRLRPWMIVLGLLIVVILPLFILWPVLYHYDAVRLGGRDYPLRINRITTHAQYYDGSQWREPPVIVQEARRVPVSSALPQAPAEPLRIDDPASAQPASPPRVKDMAPPAAPALPPSRTAREEVRNGSNSVPAFPTGGVAPPAAPLPSFAEPAGVRKISGPRPVTPVPGKPHLTSPSPSGLKAKTGTPYSIQIGAFPERGKADALAERMRAAAFPVRVDAVTLQGKGRWYRVLLGQFKDRRAAVRYLGAHRIGETCPGSFIQRAASPSE